ncbi:MAG TPA: hypothetical protein VKU86_10990 [Acidimicrobiales bacterium]|nr:hypothetical protein [Acidimicrobiales bacterium]
MDRRVAGVLVLRSDDDQVTEIHVAGEPRKDDFLRAELAELAGVLRPDRACTAASRGRKPAWVTNRAV